MKDWFRHAFDAVYLRLYAHRDEREASQAVAWLINTLQLSANMSVLDAPCGAGRHAKALAEHGMNVTGIDLSTDLLAEARKRLKAYRGAALVRADLRTLPFSSEKFDVVVNFFSSFGYFADDEENYRVALELVRCTRQGGSTVIDFMNAPHVRNHLVAENRRQTKDGWEILEKRRLTSAPAPRVEKTTTIRFGEQHQRVILESVRLYEPEELVQICERAGLSIYGMYGNYTGEPWSEESPRCIVVGKKKRSSL